MRREGEREIKKSTTKLDIEVESADAIEPSEYARWRETYLGALTERIETAAIFGLCGDVYGKRVLDLGCGDGTYSIAASQKGAIVTGLDISEAMLEAAGQRAAAVGCPVEWRRASAESLPFGAGTFDVVLAVTILCLLGETQRVIRGVHRVLRPGGAFVIGELGKYSSWALRRRARGWLAPRGGKRPTSGVSVGCDDYLSRPGSESLRPVRASTIPLPA